MHAWRTSFCSWRACSCIHQWACSTGDCSSQHSHQPCPTAPPISPPQLESLFLHTCYSTGGCRLTGYSPIAASGALFVHIYVCARVHMHVQVYVCLCGRATW